MFIPQIVISSNVEETEDKPETDYQRWLREQQIQHGAHPRSRYGEFINSPTGDSLHHSQKYLNHSTTKSFFLGRLVLLVAMLLFSSLFCEQGKGGNNHFRQNVSPPPAYSNKDKVS